jgi:hypothetical protein
MISAIILIPYLVSLLVFDLTTLMLQSRPPPSITKSLELAYFQGRKCGVFSRVKGIFPAPYTAYSLEQYKVFISHNRLGMSHFFTRSTSYLFNRAGLALRNLNLLIYSLVPFYILQSFPTIKKNWY